MVFNKNVSGFENEMEFVRYFNNKKIAEFDSLTVEFLKSLFNCITECSKIKCWKVPGYSKVDIRIKINDITKNISIKKGIKNEVHVETIDNFIEFLISLSINENSLNEIRKYLYADGTNNGSGIIRQSVSEYKEKNQKVIDIINEELNQTSIIESAVNRFLFKGRISELEVDAIIYGVVDDFLWITKEEVFKMIQLKEKVYSTALHFSFLTLQVWDRNLKRNPKYEYLRNYVQVKWYNISDDIIEAMAFVRQQRNID